MTIFESVIDQTLKNYSKFVFDDYNTNKPKLKGRIRERILDDISKISSKIEVIDFFIKGSILTKQYTEDSDIDVFVQVEPNLYTEDQLKSILKPIFDEIDDTYLEGVPYPFQYYITKEKYNKDNTEAIYDVQNDDWVKRSVSKNINIDDYMDDFKKYVDQFSDFSEELRRNMIDYEVLKDIPAEELTGLKTKLNKELRDINRNISDISEIYQQVKDMRNEGFSKDMTPSEIKKYGIKTRLPNNVVFKLLQRYHYLDLYKKIKAILGDNNKLDHDEFVRLNNVLKTRLTENVTSFKDIYKGKRSTPRHQRDLAGLTGHGRNKSAKMLGNCHRNKGIKGDASIDASKENGSRVIRVKQGSPEAFRLARKYRIDNPVGKKTVAGNQYDQGITIVFEETLEQKVKRAERKLRDK
jgi:predicted nucleotidyltransferase